MLDTKAAGDTRGEPIFILRLLAGILATALTTKL
jgi:hypothetical protein